MITQEFDLNLIPDQEPVIVHVTQYDIGAGRLIAHLYAGDVPYNISTGATVTIQGTKPDNIGFQYDDPTYRGNTVTANLTEQMCAVPGRVVTNIIVTESDNRTGTFNFLLDVQAAALRDDAVISRSDGSILDIPILVESAEESAEKSEAWAVGTRDGEAVPTTDPTYNNNAKYYAEHTAEGVEDAEAWAVGTRGGEAVPSTDETYHNNSKYYAEQSKDDSEDSEAWAVGKRGGTSVPSTDSTYHNNSKYYSEKAQNIVNEANYLIGVDPTTISNPQAPYLRLSDIKQGFFSFTPHDGNFTAETVSIPAGGFALIYLLLEDHEELLNKKLLEMGLYYSSYSYTGWWWIPTTMRQATALVDGRQKQVIQITAYNPQSSSITLSTVGLNITYV